MGLARVVGSTPALRSAPEPRLTDPSVTFEGKWREGRPDSGCGRIFDPYSGRGFDGEIQEGGVLEGGGWWRFLLVPAGRLEAVFMWFWVSMFPFSRIGWSWVEYLKRVGPQIWESIRLRPSHTLQAGAVTPCETPPSAQKRRAKHGMGLMAHEPFRLKPFLFFLGVPFPPPRATAIAFHIGSAIANAPGFLWTCAGKGLLKNGSHYEGQVVNGSQEGSGREASRLDSDGRWLDEIATVDARSVGVGVLTWAHFWVMFLEDIGFQNPETWR